MAPVTIMHIIDTPGPGGAETVCVNLLEGIDPARWRSVPVVPETGWMYDQIRRAGGEPLVLGHASRSDLPGYVMALYRLARRNDVRILHAHLLGSSFIASLLGLLLGIPVVCTLHGQVDLHPRESFKRIKFGLLNRGATRVVFVSESLRLFFLSTGLLRPGITAVIPNGVDVDAFGRSQDRSLRSALGAPGQEFLVGAVGNMRAAKGYDVLLRAAALLVARSPAYRFAVVGDVESDVGARMRSLRDELGLTHFVAFPGFLSNIPSVMNALDLYAITSRSEGFSISTVEAMAAGLPVVATRCGGPEEIIDDGITGILVENGSPEAVAGAIEDLRRDTVARRKMGRAAQTAVRERFTIKAQISAYEALYEECLAAALTREASSAGRVATSDSTRVSL